MLLVTAGDSYTYGQELCPPGFKTNAKGNFDPPPSKEDLALINLYREQHAWPRILARSMGFRECVNLARPGSSMSQISTSILDWLGNNSNRIDPENMLFVIGWTNPARMSYYDDSRGEWTTCYPINPDESKVSSFYFRHIHSEEESHHRYWTTLVMVQGMLMRFGIKHAMFNAFLPPPTNKEEHGYQKLADRSVLCLDTNMDRYCTEKGFSRGAGGHFLSDGHAAWAGYLAEWLRSKSAIIPPGLRPS
jgi:lysophospholipase L1-like esterase